MGKTFIPRPVGESRMKPGTILKIPEDNIHIRDCPHIGYIWVVVPKPDDRAGVFDFYAKSLASGDIFGFDRENMKGVEVIENETD